jgi:phosphoenolpyruvate carboxykinase (ATP)
MKEIGLRNPGNGASRPSGLKTSGAVFYNLGEADLYEQAIRRGEARLTAGGALSPTGQHTGRSPKDKFVVHARHHRICLAFAVHPQPADPPGARRRSPPSSEMTIIDLPSFKADPKRHGCRSETVIALDFERKLVLIGGTNMPAR